MDAEENSQRSSILHKVFLLLVKYTPIVVALCYIVNTLLCYFNIDVPVLSNISGISLIAWLFIFVTSLVFKFCIYYRMFMYYILITDIVNIIDYYFVIPVNAHTIFGFYFTIIGILLFGILIIYVKHHKKSISKNN